MPTLRTAGRTDIGQLRENNEDVIVRMDRLVLVADGALCSSPTGWEDIQEARL